MMESCFKMWFSDVILQFPDIEIFVIFMHRMNRTRQNETFEQFSSSGSLAQLVEANRANRPSEKKVRSSWQMVRRVEEVPQVLVRLFGATFWCHVVVRGVFICVYSIHACFFFFFMVQKKNQSPNHHHQAATQANHPPEVQ